MLSRPSNIPISAGVYLFKRRGVPLYIGKAKNLKKRLASYWRKNANGKVKSLLQEADGLEIVETQSEIEALINEAGFVKKHLPKYNVLLRDDKNYFYVGITCEEFPKIFITHQPRNRIKNREARIKNKKNLNSKFYILNSNYIGPFTSGTALKTTLKLLRRIFPYCTCKNPHKRPCVNTQIGRCAGFCCTETNFQFSIFNFQKYKENIKNITAVLTGKKKSLLKNLKKEIQKFSQEQRFEEAAKIGDQILGIENIFAHKFVLDPTDLVIASPLWDEAISRDRRASLAMTRGTWPKIEKELQTIFNSNHKISRVEGYDISNISGRDATGSMVVFTNGLPDKNEYRQFKIKTVKQISDPVRGSLAEVLQTRDKVASETSNGISDVDMLKEVLSRRIKHTEWPNPDLMLIDGGKPQLSTVLSVIEYPILQQSWDIGLRNKNLPNILVAALAKREEELYLPSRQIWLGSLSNTRYSIPTKSLSENTKLFLQRVRDEAHRFARRYHHKLRKRSLFY